MDEITFNVASVADISFFAAKITFVMAAIIIKEHVITPLVVNITYVVDKTTLKVAVITFFQWPRSFL